ncbi:hypothetical protein [Halarcobacter sp.]|uniref:hypothetical protein n=1 Tax=Halarcobacter sp. TaxID=2321133 RepID=UPI002AAB7C10|nr:hypothetical protein [Halarcobacter sp.]
MLPKELIEYSVWSHLNNYNDIQLIILKGHLLLEVILSNVVNNKELSFYAKTKILSNSIEAKEISKYLFEINKIRNELAHEWDFSVDKTYLTKWTEKILNNIPYNVKFKRTYRIKLVHSFAALASALYKIKELHPRE